MNYLLQPDVMGKLYALEAMPAKIDRIRTWVWTQYQSSQLTFVSGKASSCEGQEKSGPIRARFFL